MPRKNYSCENSDSSSLMSITGLSAKSNSESSSTTDFHSSSNNKSSITSSSQDSSEYSSSFISNSSSSTSSSTNTSSSTDCTYTDSTSNSETTTSSSSDSKNNCSVDSSEYEKECPKRCETLVKKYNHSKEQLLAISDVIVVLNFIKSKLVAVQPNINLRQVKKYTVHENIAWLESFVDTLFCVLRKNEAYKVIKVKDYKLKNDEEVVSNRTYLLKIKYETKKEIVCKNIPLVFKWSQLTNNDAISFKKVLDYVVSQIDAEITVYQAASTVPFLNNNC